MVITWGYYNGVVYNDGNHNDGSNGGDIMMVTNDAYMPMMVTNNGY